jgi:16S rRNA (cytosine1402-N4)-methyltransferase
MTVYRHIPVMLCNSAELLVTSPDGIYVDATLGLGGHAGEILKHISPAGKLVGFDVDPEALALAKKRLKDYPNTVFLRENFKKIKVELTRLNLRPVSGILFDLGLSSLEIDNPQKGFSFMNKGPLDMRMDPDLPHSSADIINHAPADTLKKIIREYGEERFAGRIAAAIDKKRKESPFLYTTDLENVIRHSVQGPHVIKSLARVFQAFRIAVNHELEILYKALPDAFECLVSGGRMVVISYHSLEDRIVKQMFKDWCTDCICPPDQPVCTCDHPKIAKRVIKKHLTANTEEKKGNPRSRSAKLRCIEKL